MRRISRLSIYLLIVSMSTLASAQKLAPVITASSSGERVVRFGSPAAGLAQIRVQILSAGGNPLFDSTWKDGNLFDWPIEQLAAGSYRCVVMVKDLDGQVTRKEFTLSADGDRISIEPVAEESSPKIAMLAHDEKEGAVVNTSGDLTFRLGEFFASKDKERMRLTAAGFLGIGTDKPQAPLDVNGLIRTTEGIMFSDGTVLTTEGGNLVTRRSDGANPPISRVIGGLQPGSQTSGNPRRLNPGPNALAPEFVVDAAGVHIGTTNAFGLDVAGNVTLSSNLGLPVSTTTAGVITLGGVRFIHAFGTQNTFIGTQAGNVTMTGAGNTVSGNQAFMTNTSGGSNTADGTSALQNNLTGDDDTAVGYAALVSNSSGTHNTAVGTSALALNTTGFSNAALGTNALLGNTTGTANIGIGYGGGQNLTTGDSNIDIGNSGVAAEAGTIRIGTEGTHTRFFVAGVRNVPNQIGDGLHVLINSAGQLQTLSSSAAVKRDIADIGEESSALMKLRPVSYVYRADTLAIRQYGLIAEEVAEVMPQLVQFSPAGAPQTVRYHFLPPLLLDQVQKQERKIEEQQKTIDALTERLEKLERQIVRNQ